jgi:hypothetical protein
VQELTGATNSPVASVLRRIRNIVDIAIWVNQGYAELTSNTDSGFSLVLHFAVALPA